MAYLGNSPGVASQRVESAFTATSSQTAFTPSSGYTLGYCDVYQNGVKLVNGDDYTASDGATVTLATGAASGDSIVIVASFPRGLTDGYLKSEADAKYVALTGAQTVAGVKTFSSQIVGIAGTAGAPAITTTGDTNTGIFFPAADTIAFAEGGVEAMRLDSAGNMGLGVTPSAWGSVSRAMQFQNGVSIFSNTSGLGGLGNNVYSNPGTADYYIANGYATRYYQFNGTHVWNTAASGTAGNAITFTQAMTLDNVALGSAYSSLSLNNTTGGGVVFQQSGTAKMSIFNAGNDGYIDRNNAAGNLYFRNTALGRTDVVFDSSGNLLVGTTDAGDTTGNGVKIYPSFAGAPSLRLVGNSTASNVYPFMVRSSSNNTWRTYIDYAGNIYSQNTSITSLSDARLKENIRDLDVGLAELMALKPRKFDWKEGKGGDTKDVRGFIAQEVEEVFPDLIGGWADPAPEGEEPYKSVRADLIPVLVKAIQEQQAIIQQLQADVATLKGQS
jgi:hypothetical protein